MSLSLSGQLGLAQLGVAELGQLATAALAAGGFPIIFGGALKPEDKKKPKKKKVRKRKSKRVKVRASAFPRPTEQPKPDVPPNLTPAALPEIPPLELSEPIREAMAETEQHIAEAKERERLKRQIAEEDELLLLVI